MTAAGRCERFNRSPEERRSPPTGVPAMPTLIRSCRYAATLLIAIVATAVLAASARADTTITPTEGAPFSGEIGTGGSQCGVGSFQASTAVILWGDGASSDATETLDPASNEISLSGTHTYAEAGSYSGSFDATYTCNGAAAGFRGAFTATVADAPLSAQGTSFTATPGVAFSGTVATVTDANPDAVAADLTATIAWGDGTTGAGTVTVTSAGAFTVTGGHTYASPSPTPLTVTVTVDDSGGATATATGSATVGVPVTMTMTATTTTPTGTGTTPVAPTPPPPALPVVGASFTVSGIGAGTATLDAGGSAPVGAIVARYDWSVPGAGGDIVCPGDEPVLELHTAAGLSQSVSLTAVDATSGVTTTIAHPLQIPARPGAGRAQLVTGLCLSPSSPPVPPLDRDTAPRSGLLQNADGAPPVACADDVEFGAVDVHGCLSPIPNAQQLPGGLTEGLERLLCRAHAAVFCLLDFTNITNTVNRALLGHARRAAAVRPQLASIAQQTVVNALANGVVPDYYSWNAVSLDGIDVVPQGGVPLLIIPSANAIVSSQVKLYLDGHLMTPAAIPLALYAPDAGGRLGQITLPHALPVIGSLPFTGSISVDLHRAHSLLPNGDTCQYACAALTVAASLPGVFSDDDGNGLSASGVVTADDPDGVALDSLEIKIPAAQLAGIGVSDLDIRYRAGDDSLHAQATFDLFEAAGQITGVIDLSHGSFQDASLDWDAGDGPGIDLGGPLDISLVHLGGSVALDPTVISANAAISGGPNVLGCSLIGINGAVTLHFSPFAFDADADGYLLCQHVAHEFLHFDDSGYFAFGGQIDIHFLIFEIEGGMSVAVDVPQGHFQYDGNEDACLNIFGGHFCLGGEVVVSDRGIGVCADLGFVHAGGGIQWPAHGLIFFDTCDIGKFRSLGYVTAAGNAPRDFRIPPGQRVAVIGVAGSGDAPDVTLTGPGGRTIATPAAGFIKMPQDVVVRDDQQTDTTYFFINHPEAGAWRATPVAGSPAITGIEQAASLPTPEVHAGVRPAPGRREQLHYTVKPIPGQTVTFAERAPNHSFRVIGTAHGDAGRLTFTPSDQLARPRTILALVSQDGHPRTDLTVARFTAPRPLPLSAPRALRVTRDPAGLRVRWHRVAGAARYLLAVRAGAGAARHVSTTTTSATIAGVQRLRAVTVTVAGRPESHWAGATGRRATVKIAAGGRPAPHRVHPIELHHR